MLTSGREGVGVGGGGCRYTAPVLLILLPGVRLIGCSQTLTFKITISDAFSQDSAHPERA